MAKLIVVNSNSLGNAYAIDTGKEILLLEAGVKMADVKKAIDFRIADVVGCALSHAHGDHAKYAGEYARFGVKVYSNQDVADKKSFPYGSNVVMEDGKTYRAGGFYIVPFANHHDVPIFGYLIRHKSFGTLLFSTDSYKLTSAITGIDHYLIEANYSDAILKDNVWNGKIDKAQADRIMLSHMSLDYCIKYLQDSKAEATAKTITLCHLSGRNSNPEQFKETVAGTFGIPCFIAQPKLVVNLSKDIL